MNRRRACMPFECGCQLPNDIVAYSQENNIRFIDRLLGARNLTARSRSHRMPPPFEGDCQRRAYFSRADDSNLHDLSLDNLIVRVL